MLRWDSNDLWGATLLLKLHRAFPGLPPGRRAPVQKTIFTLRHYFKLLLNSSKILTIPFYQEESDISRFKN